MPRKIAKSKSRYPDARLTGMRAFFELLRAEPDWRPDPVDVDTLKSLGIAVGKERNTLFALEFLGVINTQGSPTKDFDGLRADYQPTLRKLVRSGYAKLFQTIPTSRANQATLVRFFRTNGYSEETAEYQAKLFVYVCKEAAINLPIAETTFKRSRFAKDSGERRKPRTQDHPGTG
jgi:hypothetical protein